MNNESGLSVVLGLTLDEALGHLDRCGVIVQDVIETRPPGKTLIGPLRVLAVRRLQSGVILVVSRSWPPPGA